MASPAAAATTDSHARFSWSIENFSRLNTEKLYSEVFYAGRCKWRILLYPGGNNSSHLSVYLDVADSNTLTLGWNRDAQFGISVINHLDLTSSVKKESVHRFVEGYESDWGFTKFMLLSDLKDPARGYLLNDTLSVEADVTVRSAVEYSIEEEVPSVGGSKNCETRQGGLEQEASNPPESSAPVIPPIDSCTIHQAGHNVSSDQASIPDMVDKAIQLDATPAALSASNTVKFLSYHVSSEAFLILEKICNLHKNTFTQFSLKAPIMQTAVLESFATFIKSMSTTKVSEMNEEALCSAALVVKDFDLVGLDLSWLNQRLDEAKRVNKHLQSLNTIDSYVKDLEVARAKVCELEEKIAKAREEAESLLPESLGVNDYVLAGVF